MLLAAQQAWEKDQINLAVSLSLETSDKEKEQRARSHQIVARRLSKIGLKRVETPPHGDCQFIAVAWTAGLAIDPFAFRQEVVAYLASLPSFFSPWFDSRFKDYESYLAHMGREGSWGDDLCLLAMSHLILRPIHLVTDREDEEEALMVVEPPEQISREAWGEPIVIAYLGFRHYEATEKIQPGPVKSEP